MRAARAEHRRTNRELGRLSAGWFGQRLTSHILREHRFQKFVGVFAGHWQFAGQLAFDVQPETVPAAQFQKALLNDRIQFLHHQHILALDAMVQVLENAHNARGLCGGAVAGNGHEVDAAGDFDAAKDVGKHRDGALEDADEQQLLACVIAVDLGGELVQPGLNGLVGNQDALNLILRIVHGSTLLYSSAA